MIAMQRPLVGAETYDQVVSAASTPMLGADVPCGLRRVTSSTCIEALPATDWCQNCVSLWNLYHQRSNDWGQVTR